eukprot:7126611-Pyramimonas_sp.AAC.1
MPVRVISAFDRLRGASSSADGDRMRVASSPDPFACVRGPAHAVVARLRCWSKRRGRASSSDCCAGAARPRGILHRSMIGGATDKQP